MRKITPLPPVWRLDELLDYDPDTGILTWRPRPLESFKSIGAGKAWNAKYARSVAGAPNGRGYLRVRLNGARSMVHRICYALAFGWDPGDSQIDHVNGDKTDNRAANLRPASHTENGRHLTGRRANNTSGYRGVSWHCAHSKWSAYVMVSGKNKYLGLFDDLEEAAAVVATARREMFGAFDGTVLRDSEASNKGSARPQRLARKP